MELESRHIETMTHLDLPQQPSRAGLDGPQSRTGRLPSRCPLPRWMTTNTPTAIPGCARLFLVLQEGSRWDPFRSPARDREYSFLANSVSATARVESKAAQSATVNMGWDRLDGSKARCHSCLFASKSKLHVFVVGKWCSSTQPDRKSVHTSQGHISCPQMIQNSLGFLLPYLRHMFS